MSLKQLISLAKQTYTKWSDHQAPRLGASVAFYSILSFAPLLVLITGLIGLVFGHESANGALINEARQVIGDRGADTVDSLLKSAQKPASGTFASIAAFITLLFGASGVFAELQDALNIMWDAPKANASGFMALVKQRLFSFGMILTVGFLLLISLLLSAGLAYVGHSLSYLLPMPHALLQLINFVVSFVVVTLLFALMFKYVPSVKIAWREVIVGAIGTALLFTIGKFLLGIYLGKASVGSTYGAAGSLVAVVVWIYYSAQIFFFGAEFTRVHADAHQKQSVNRNRQTPVSEERNEAATSPKFLEAAAASNSAAVPYPIQTRTASANAVQSAPAAAPILTPAAIPQVEPEQERIRRVPFAPSRPAKPRLLAAVAIGFVLGRVTQAIAKRSKVQV